MTPRRYSLGRRAATAASTRARILDAAVSLYGERGVQGTTLQAVAERADVSRGTVVHHFGGTDGLLEAVLDRALETLSMPSPRQLERIERPADRVRWLVREMYAFFDRSGHWFELFRNDRARPVLVDREQAFWLDMSRLRDAALGDLAGKHQVASTVSGLVHPATLGALRSTGLSLEEAGTVIGDLLAGLVDRELAATR